MILPTARLVMGGGLCNKICTVALFQFGHMKCTRVDQKVTAHHFSVKSTLKRSSRAAMWVFCVIMICCKSCFDWLITFIFSARFLRHLKWLLSLVWKVPLDVLARNSWILALAAAVEPCPNPFGLWAMDRISELEGCWVRPNCSSLFPTAVISLFSGAALI